MYIEKLFDTATIFLQHHVYIGMGLVIIVSLYTLKKPLAAVRFFTFCLAMVVVLYIASLAGQSMFTGVEKTDKMVHHTVK